MADTSLSTAPAHDARPIDGQTRLFFVIGNPVAQVQAPTVINPLLAQAGINARVVPLEVAAQQLEATCRALLACGNVGGLLVTVPFKQAAFPLCDEASAEAAQARGVNAMRRAPDGRIVGALFDGLGFVRGLQAAGHDPAGRRVLLLGAGGAGSAIAVALATAGVSHLSIFDPGTGRAPALADSLGRRHAAARFEAIAQPDPRGHDIVINATPLGMKPDDPLPVDADRLDPATLVADVIMKPADTRLLQAARSRGCATHAGRHMLDHQLPAYLEFFGLHDAIAFASAQLESTNRHDPHP